MYCEQSTFIPEEDIVKYDSVLWESTYLIQTASSEPSHHCTLNVFP